MCPCHEEPVLSLTWSRILELGIQQYVHRTTWLSILIPACCVEAIAWFYPTNNDGTSDLGVYVGEYFVLCIYIVVLERYRCQMRKPLFSTCTPYFVLQMDFHVQGNTPTSTSHPDGTLLRTQSSLSPLSWLARQD